MTRNDDEQSEQDGRRRSRRKPVVPDLPPLQPRRPGAAGTGRGAISEARAYTPRARTVRETGLDELRDGHVPAARKADEEPATGKRPALRVLRGGAGSTDEQDHLPPHDAVRGRRDPRDPASRTASNPSREGSSRRAGSGNVASGRAPSNAAGRTASKRTDSGKAAARGRTPERRAPTGATSRRRPPIGTGARARTAPGGDAGPGALVGVLLRRRRPRRTRRFDADRRLRAGITLAVLVFVVLGGRLVQLQLSDGKAFAAAGLRARLHTISLPAVRGSILDRNGNVLAQSVQTKYVFADPTEVKNPVATATKLRDLLDIPIEQLVPLLTQRYQSDGKTPERFVYLARGVDLGTAAQVMALKLDGINVGDDEKRVEPGHDLAANLIGFVGTDQTGLAGLEYKYNSLLAGKDGSETYEMGDGDVPTKLPGGYDEITPAHSGDSVTLTIDRDLQYQVQQILYQQMSESKADYAAAVVLNAKTGEVLAQASYPSYDAASYQNYPQSTYRDAATSVTTDPGSTMKIVALSAALQTGAIQPDSMISIGPSIVKGGQRYYDDTRFPQGTKISLAGILAYSSNVGAITVASKLPSEAATLYQYQQLFGLGKVTGEGLPNEAPGDVLPASQWTGTSYGSIPIGYGIEVTPLQMTALYATIANDGVYVQPHVIASTRTASGKTVPAPAAESHRVLSTSVAQELRTDLEAVTTASGATAKRAAVKGYLIAGKTGTASQVGAGGTYRSGSAVDFIGMAPASDPQYVIGVFAHTPSGAGGSIAAPAFAKMMAFTLQHYQVPPTGDVAPKFILTEK